MPSASARTLELDRTRDESVAWRLIRAEHAPLIAGILGTHLGAETRRLPAADLFELVDDDLEELRALGVELPKSAQGYCSDWRTAGFLVRRPSDEARGETYELSPGALQALRTLDELTQPKQTATESRLASIADQLTQLAIDTDPDAVRRLEQLHAQRDRIDAEIERVHAGEASVLDSERALERARDILAQVAEMPSDFARVRAEFEQLNRMLRERIISSDASQRAVLDEVFRGVDLIAESDQGRSFAAFNGLLLRPEAGAGFDDSVERVLDREFAGTLTLDQRRALRRFIPTLKSLSGEIQDVVTAFARGLRRYVQSQEFQRDRVLRDSLREALAAAVPASKAVKPYTPTSVQFDLSAVALGGIGNVTLFDPAEVDATAPFITHEPATTDLEVLRAIARETEIDFDELIRNVNAFLRVTPEATLAEVFERYPATQGVASIVGLLAIASAQGVATDGFEHVSWRGADDVERSAKVPQFRFTGRVV